MNPLYSHEARFQISLLRGHRGSVNCLAVGRFDDKLLISGSDDKTVRMWDLRMNGARAARCFMGFAEPINALSEDCSQGPASRIYIASGNSVYCVDSRGQSDVLSSEHKVVESVNMERTCVYKAADEVSALCCRDNGSALLASDDSGVVMEITMHSDADGNERDRVRRALPSRHSSLVSTCCYGSDSSNGDWSAFSGGMDCMLCRYQFSSLQHDDHDADAAVAVHGHHGGVSLTTVNMNEARGAGTAATAAAASTQVVNPPMVHAVAPALSGRAAVTAMGDGSVRTN